jgi:hypothetical protein
MLVDFPFLVGKDPGMWNVGDEVVAAPTDYVYDACEVFRIIDIRETRKARFL